jgi:hypothetical protein
LGISASASNSGRRSGSGSVFAGEHDEVAVPPGDAPMISRTSFRSTLAAFAALATLAIATTSATGCAAPPEKLCEHVLELQKEGGGKSMGKTACEMKIGFKKQTLGLVKYRSYAACIEDAKSMDDVVKCEP